MPNELHTERLHLRPWRADDAVSHRQLWTERDPRALRQIDADGRPTVQDLRARMATQHPNNESGLCLYAVERLGGPAFVGYCGLIIGGASIEEPEIAFEFAKSHHGKGYATEAAAAVVDAAAASGRARLWATVREWNIPSLRVLDKLGFHHSGRIDSDPDRGNSIWMTVVLTTGS